MKSWRSTGKITKPKPPGQPGSASSSPSPAGPEGETVIRRAARVAARGAGGKLLAVHVTRSDGLTGTSPRQLARQRQLVENLGGTYHHVVGDDFPEALLDFARGVNAAQLVLGSSRRDTWQPFFGRGVASIVTPLSADFDLHIVTHEEVGKGRLPARRRVLSRRRLVASWLLTVVGQPVLAIALANTRDAHELTTEMLLFLTLAVGVALLGGIVPSLIAAILGALLLNFLVTDPLHTFRFSDPENLVAVVLFPVFAVAVASVVDLAARRATDAAQSRTEADVLSNLATSILRGERGLQLLLEQIRETFATRSVSLLERDDGRWRCVASSGNDPAERPNDADAAVPVNDNLVLALRGRVFAATDRRILEPAAEHAVAALERQRLTDEVRTARRLAESNRIRTAFLAAVSHDLRTPVAAIKAAVSTLRQLDLELPEEDSRVLLADIEDSADRLDRLVANLLDMSRVQTCSVTPILRDVTVDEIVGAALLTLADHQVELTLSEALPAVHVDPGLVERSVANIAENAIRHNHGAKPVAITASVLYDMVEVRVVDHGPGVPDDQKERIFEPFQRLEDVPAGNGAGLGLAVARGFAEILGGGLHAEDTPRRWTDDGPQAPGCRHGRVRRRRRRRDHHMSPAQTSRGTR